MKKSVVLLVFAMFTTILSGCILSKTPSTNDVTMNLGEEKTFSVNVFPSGGTYSWTMDNTPISNSGKSYTYNALAGGHTLIVRATHILGTDTQAWNIYGNSPPPTEIDNRINIISRNDKDNFVHGGLIDWVNRWYFILRIEVDPSGGWPAISIIKGDLDTLKTIDAVTHRSVYVTEQIQGIVQDDDNIYVFYDCGYSRVSAFRKSDLERLHDVYIDPLTTRYSQGGAFLKDLSPDSIPSIYHIGGSDIVLGNVVIWKRRADSLAPEAYARRWNTHKISIAGQIIPDPGDNRWLYVLGSGSNFNSYGTTSAGVIIRARQQWVAGSPGHTTLIGDSVVKFFPTNVVYPKNTTIDIGTSILDLTFDGDNTIWAVGSVPKEGDTGSTGKGGDGVILRIIKNDKNNMMAIDKMWRVHIDESRSYGCRLSNIRVDHDYLYISSRFEQHTGLGDFSEPLGHHKGLVMKIDKNTMSLIWARGLDSSSGSARTNFFPGCMTLNTDNGRLYLIGSTTMNSSMRNAMIAVFNTKYIDPASNFYSPDGTIIDSDESSYITIKGLDNHGVVSEGAFSFLEENTSTRDVFDMIWDHELSVYSDSIFQLLTK